MNGKSQEEMKRSLMAHIQSSLNDDSNTDSNTKTSPDNKLEDDFSTCSDDELDSIEENGESRIKNH